MNPIGWCQGKWSYKKKEAREPILITNMYGKEAVVQYYNHTIAKKAVWVWKSSDWSINKQGDVLIDKANYQSRNISSSHIKCHLDWQSLKEEIWLSLAYILPATTISWKQGNIVSQEL